MHIHPPVRVTVACTLVAFVLSAPPTAPAQKASSTSAQPAPVTFTAEQDHQNMMEQLGIQALRPGPSGNEKDPNHANYNPASANPYPDLPNALRMNDGQEVTTPEMWWKKRRPQIIEGFEQYVYGRIPANVPKVTWRATVTEKERVGWLPAIATQLVGHVDNSSHPSINVDISMMLVIPANAKGPVPVLIMFGPAAFPNPTQPSPDELSQINTALKAELEQRDPSLKSVFDQHPAYQLIRNKPFMFPVLNADGDPPSTMELIAAGWGYAMLDPASVQADNGAGLTQGIIGLVNHGQPRKPDDWGALRAWEWGAARGLDYLETNPAVDAKHVGIEGVSRYGKAALVTLAFEPRFAFGLIGSSGKGGVTPFRRNFGEAVENLTGSGEYHWMAGNFLKYGASNAKFGSKNPGDIPVDSNELIALCAPRLTFISYGLPSKGDAKWLDHQGSFMATVAASPVYQLLGVKGLVGVSGDYRMATMPPVNVSLLDGRLAWRQDDGGHTDAPNMKYFIQWVDKWIGYSARPAQ